MNKFLFLLLYLEGCFCLVVFLSLMVVLVFLFPYWLGDAENFKEANPLVTLIGRSAFFVSKSVQVQFLPQALGIFV